VILGSSSKFKGTGYVCFLDVLGFSSDILNNWEKSSPTPLEKILAVKRQIPIFSDLGNDGHSASCRVYTCRVNTVSDSVTICFGYSDKLIIGDLVLGLEALLANVSNIWSAFINSGYTLRGAIDFGSIYWDDNELIGPALINAYRLESEVAKNSRVIVSGGVNKILKDLTTDHSGALTDHLMLSFRKDVDGYVIVNPNLLYRSDHERTLLINNLRKTRDANRDGIIREKYNPLIRMLSEDRTISLSPHDLAALD
jgi:hypothetical protein